MLSLLVVESRLSPNIPDHQALVTIHADYCAPLGSNDLDWLWVHRSLTPVGDGYVRLRQCEKGK